MKRTFVYSLYLILIFILCPYSLYSQDAGNTGLAFLKIGFGARNISLGDLGVVGINDLTSINYNPAQLTKITSAQISFTQNNLIQDVSSQMFAAGFIAFGIPIAVGINNTSIPNIEVREKPGPALSVFDAHYFMGSISSAIEIQKQVSIGMTIKYLYENIFIEDATGFGIDLGVTYLNLLSGLEFGASIKNLGSMNKLKNESTKLPADLRFGVAYAVDISSLKTKFNFVGGYQRYLNTEDNHFHIGAEAIYNNLLSLRAGYITGYDSKNFSAGVGIKWNGFDFDFAYVPFKYGLGDSKIVSLLFTF
ncbi:PorV/PorQ family protein [Melioribacteraceae bacterium 4301-Me]|uniref:PorV/PorQ family protein n=1 Tax=Pyranulibacter aquaticus TaxID=3163344 RepID=UPI003596532B